MTSPAPAPPRGRAPRFARTLAIAVACLLGLAAPARPQAAVRANAEAESEPRLILPGGRSVRPGQWIDLRWSEAGGIEEMEILLSTDGGRHYRECISPRLDPGARHFVWRVPANLGRDLRLRIRFNRGGREIEGAPAAVLAVRTGDPLRPEPLALPPLAGGDGEREPRAPVERGSAPTSGASSDSLEAADDLAAAPAGGTTIESRSSHPGTPRPAESAIRSRFAPPRSVPLRT